MKKAIEIFREGDHAWTVIARDPERPGHLIDTNEYLITHRDDALLTDPGGLEIFPAVFSAVCTRIDPRTLRALFASHQDPDIISSLSLWLELDPSLRCYASWLWASFIPHFGGSPDTIVPLPDEGAAIPLGRLALQALPAHYLHSSGNFHLWDPAAGILFTGDVGAALFPPDRTDPFVKDFDDFVRHAEGFHVRWMGSNEAKRDWCERVARLPVRMLCPQHGAILRDADVQRFVTWFDGLKVGRTRARGG